ncbi:polysaccharide deacetylase family protein [Haloarchaeobius amylolyticus]|uniref:polysaccharide deacetylase family protein n=1 Tax=Haloarchaeobius amylolyticus TaxID=1198296 RepID=UPI002271D46D|nr:polysaccharide deacetylase family protein [Haloarchaeobius amylolyticus]
MSIVTLSLEVELGWGVHDIDEYERISTDRERESRYLRRLLSHCDDVGVPFSFDVVGHLFHAACSGDHGSPHDEGWFGDDPGTDWQTDPLFYAPDLVADIRDAETDHEICTHSYSHVSCDEADDETIRWDLEEAQEVHQHVLGERTVSFVPPKHEQPPTHVLRDAGIEIIRMHRPDGVSKPRKFKRLVTGPHPEFSPAVTMEDDVVVTYCTEYPSLTSALLPSGRRETHPAFRYLPLDNGTRRRLHRQYLRDAAEQALENDTPVHLWAHLYDLANEQQFLALRDFLTDLAALEAQTDLEVMTMAELNDRVRAEERAHVVV